MRCWAPAALQLGFRVGPHLQGTVGWHRCTEARRCWKPTVYHNRMLTLAPMAAAASSAAVPLQRSRHVSAAAMPLDGLLQRVADCNCSADEMAQLVPFVIDTDTGVAKTLGCLTPGFAGELAELAQFEATYDVENTGSTTPTRVRLRPRDSSQKACTAALAEATTALRQAGTITGWRDELYPVTHAFGAPPAALIERAATPYFGIKAYGVHINGYVRGPGGQLQLWVARRSRTKPTWPSLLDHIAAGGQPAGLSCIDNVVKECEEEASIPAEIARTARPVGAVSYAGLTEQGFKTDVLFCYDLELPPDFQPQPQDCEVESFELLPIDKVAHIMAESRNFKPNCCLVIIDFMIRHGVLTPDQTNYAELVRALHV